MVWYIKWKEEDQVPIFGALHNLVEGVKIVPDPLRLIEYADKGTKRAERMQTQTEVFESLEKYVVINCVKSGGEVKQNQGRNLSAIHG